MRHRESVSGGAGADATEGDSNFKDSIHTWNFCAGKLPTMVYEELMSQKCGGDIGTGLADAVIADGFAGAGSSVPGGTGTRSIAHGNGAQSTGARGKRVRKSDGGDDKAAAWASVSALMSTMQQTALLDQVEAKGDGLEQLADDVLRVTKKLADLPADADDESWETFEELLQDAKDELKQARARKRAKRAAVAEVRV